jgi:thermitase
MTLSSPSNRMLLSFTSRGVSIPVSLLPLEEAGVPLPSALGRRSPRAGATLPPMAATPNIAALIAASPFMAQRFPLNEARIVSAATLVHGPRPRTARGFAPREATVRSAQRMTLATCTVIVEGARAADLAAVKNRGARLLHEGFDGKILLQCDTVEQAFGIANLLQERRVGSATPNFVRYVSALPASTTAGAPGWPHKKLRVPEAWQVTRGSSEIKIAVLDEGVDANHTALSAALVAQKDFIGGNGNSATPTGNDAHGTACAGIIVSRDATRPGIANKCSLIAARIGMGDGSGGWAFDDYATADAIDWGWREGADVLSNSWGGGLPSDAISRALGRARTQGRGGRGSVVVIAAGNSQTPLDFPANLPGYITVGASTPADERKTFTSSDGETWWGSCFGSTMWLLAPGVFVPTTDIAGPRGTGPGDFTDGFNGTSAATPHVAATAALILSVAPSLSASEVRDILKATAVHLPGQSAWSEENGWGRLDVAAAVALAGGPSPQSAIATRAPSKRNAKKPSLVARSARTKKASSKQASMVGRKRPRKRG